MFPRISRNSKRIIAILSQNRSPSQIAWGIAVGIMIGLIPKDNLVAISLLVMIGFLRVNQLVACSTAIAIHLFSGMLSTITISIGNSLLEQQFITDSIVFLYQFPILPWTCLENAQVVGGLGVGLTVLLPAYAICVWSLSKARNRLDHIELEHVADNAIQYRKSVTEQSKMRQHKPLHGLKLLDENSQESAIVATITSEILTSEILTSEILTSEILTSEILTSEILTLDKPQNPGIKTDDLRQASKETARRAERKIQQRVMPTIFTGESHWEGNETILRETIIEVVRYRRPISQVKQPTNSNDFSPAASPTQGISMPAGNVSTANSNDSNSDAFSSVNSALKNSPSISFDSGHVPGHTNSRDESLRYLLWHINGSRENVRKSSEKTA